MKRKHVAIVVIGCALLLPLTSVGTQVQPFDSKKCQQELEIMKGILRTTLEFASEELASGSKDEKTRSDGVARRFPFRRSDFNIEAFYLSGEGAVFTIPTSALRDSLRARRTNLPLALALPSLEDIGLNEAWIEQLETQLNQLSKQLRDAFGLEGAVAVAAVPSPPAAPAPPAPPSVEPPQGLRRKEPMAARQNQLREKLEDLQEKVKRRSAEEEARQAKLREHLAQLKVYLIEAIANHGDSLTVLKPDEYLNLVIVGEGSRWFGSDPGDRAPREIISVQKSAIADYKSGRLSLNALKQKVLTYEN